MIVYYDHERTYSEPRLHPYAAATPEQSGHVDFKERPALIRTVLEDFLPFSDQKAVQTFYSFLEWINEPDCHLETCDCALRPPALHQDTNSSLALSVHGRLFVMYRNLALNSSADYSDWLRGALMTNLSRTDPDLSAHEAVVGFTFSPVLQTAISAGRWLPGDFFDAAHDDPGLGRHLMLSFWAYGNTAEGAFGNLDRLFTNLWAACRIVSDVITRGINNGQPAASPQAEASPQAP